jgi:hypothetical protein
MLASSMIGIATIYALLKGGKRLLATK